MSRILQALLLTIRTKDVVLTTIPNQASPAQLCQCPNNYNRFFLALIAAQNLPRHSLANTKADRSSSNMPEMAFRKNISAHDNLNNSVKRIEKKRDSNGSLQLARIARKYIPSAQWSIKSRGDATAS
eukprot:scaffold5943_cov148-Skeletonema_menzelii.AAC.1